MSDDDLLAEDVEGAMLTGEITQKFTRDPRGTRYEVTGDTMDGHRTCGVCRFLPSGGLDYHGVCSRRMSGDEND